MSEQTSTVFKVQEIFASIQGEGVDAGKPCTFIRLFGCNLKCSYCDQVQGAKDCHRYSIARIISEVLRLNVPYVCITGGEPMVQWEAVYPLVLELVQMGYKVAIETNGCCPIDLDEYNRSFKYIMDVKCPSSGYHERNVLDNLLRLQQKDEVVFVIADRQDYEFAKKIIAQYPTPATLILSPCFDSNNNPMIKQSLVDWILDDKLHNVRVSIQIHKCLGVR